MQQNYPVYIYKTIFSSYFPYRLSQNIEYSSLCYAVNSCPYLFYVCMSAKSCPTLCHPLDCSPPGSSVHGILQVRILKWVAVALFQGIFPTQGLNLRLLHLLQWQAGSKAPLGSPCYIVCVLVPYS